MFIHSHPNAFYLIVIAAAGNDGSEGAFYISSPGTGIDNIAVASIDNVYNLQQTALSEAGNEYRTLFFPFPNYTP